MRVMIKDFHVEMEVKNNGIEFEVQDSDKKQIGDCYVSKTGIVWCDGKTTRENGVQLPWEKLKLLCASSETLKAAVAAAKKIV